MKSMLSSSFILLLLILNIPDFTQALRCHKCLKLECTIKSPPYICDNLKRFVLSQLGSIYHGYDVGGPSIPSCPEPEDEDRWNNLATDSYSSESCPAQFCALGRLKVVTTIAVPPFNNYTTYGTVLGCAKKKLVDLTAAASRNQICSVVEGTSDTRNSLRHYLEIEHCYSEKSMCQQRDFCIPRGEVDVRVFLEDRVDSMSWKVKIMIILFAVGLLVVGVVTFLGIKYDV